jgi:hypothetical protein
MKSRRGRVGRGAAVERVFEPGDHRVEGRRIGPAHIDRRHHARTQLARDQFPGLRVAMYVGGIKGIERELAGGLDARGFRPLAVARVTELLEELLFACSGNDRRRGRRCCLGRLQNGKRKTAGGDDPRQQ